jgi:hypothetical protein
LLSTKQHARGLEPPEQGCFAMVAHSDCFG